MILAIFLAGLIAAMIQICGSIGEFWAISRFTKKWFNRQQKPGFATYKQQTWVIK